MKATNLYFPTLREAPSDADIVSHQLLVRGGFIRKLAAGVYTYLPLGWKVHQKIAEIVRQEMNRIGGQEILMPALVPLELLEESGRDKVPVLFHLKDRNERDFCLGFTHEEVIADLARTDIQSWRQMPLYLYQIQTKFRDEPRPRGGLLRVREFTMKDGYSLDFEDAGLDSIFEKNHEAYARVFHRCGMEFVAVEADPGAIGGSENREFMLLAESGEDSVLQCERCGYGVNAEVAEIRPKPITVAAPDSVPSAEVVDTPGAHTVEQVCQFLKAAPQQLIKTILCRSGDRVVAALVRGDRDLCLPKLGKAVGEGLNFELADSETVERVTRAPVGFAGPVGLSGVEIIADPEVLEAADGITGANQPERHLVHVQYGRDYTATQVADIRTAGAGDGCPKCADGHYRQMNGIEVGHIFKLGLRYSKAMGVCFQDETGQNREIIMGSYGLGISRTVAAIIEAYHDEDGIAWPISVAPFDAVAIQINSDDPSQTKAAEAIYHACRSSGVDMMWDERNERPGVKFKDADLIGIPIQVVIGRGIMQGKVEIRLRSEKGHQEEVVIDGAPLRIAEIKADLLNQLKPD